MEKIDELFVWLNVCVRQPTDLLFFPAFSKMEPYRFRECSPAMQAFKNRYWISKDIRVVLPPGFTGTKQEIAHCVLVLGCLIEAKERGVYGERDVLLQNVYGADKTPLADDAQRAYHHYKEDTAFTLSWIEWLLLSLNYSDVLHCEADQIRPLARLLAIEDLRV